MPGETNNQEKLQRTTKHGIKQEITKVHTRQGRRTQDRNRDTHIYSGLP